MIEISPFIKRKKTTLVICNITLASTLFISAVVSADIFSVTRYVKIDTETKSAYMFDENFNMLPENPFVPQASIEYLPEGQPLWYLGSKIDVVTRDSSGAINVRTTDPRYTEMNHHVVWAYVSDNKELTDQCGYNRPLAAGSEMTDVQFPGGYGYKMDGGAFFAANWHWTNPAKIPVHEEVYLRFVTQYDDSPSGYRDLNVSWVDMVPCDSTFIVKPGKSKVTGPDHPVDRKARIVAVYPHVHDHNKKIKLLLNGDGLREFEPENANIAVEHDDVGQGPNPYHVDSQHLPSEGLRMWNPGINGPILNMGDNLSVMGKFNNTHDYDIDNMALFILYWEDLSQ